MLLALLLMGCPLPSARPQKGGSASVGPSASVMGTNPVNTSETASVGNIGLPHASITQPENPQATSGQAVEFESVEETTIPFDTVKTTVTDYGDGRKVTVQEPIPAGTKVVKRVRQKVEQSLGGSWKDTAREMAAALGSFQSVQYVGIAIFLFGAVGFFHPVVRTLIGGKDVAMAVGGAGLLMMFGPFLFVTYSKFFFLAIVLAGVYWLVARFKYQHGRLDALESSQPPKQ